MLVEIPVSGGDLIDRITILEIKAERMTDPRQLDNVRAYLEELRAVRNRTVAASPELTAMTGELKSLNGALWDVEDELRRCERRGDFGPRFIELARSVYRTNDRRAAVKRCIDELLDSAVIEEKSYPAYD